MRHLKIMGLCLVAVFALAAVAASSASAAEPEWGGCVAQKHGNFTEEMRERWPKSMACRITRATTNVGGAGCHVYGAEARQLHRSGLCDGRQKHGVPDHKGHYEKTPAGQI